MTASLQVTGGLFGGSTPFPSGPHVIIATNTLIGNWIQEISMWMKGVDVFIYAGGPIAQQGFFAEGSLWQLSEAKMHRRIVVTTLQVMFLSQVKHIPSIEILP